MNGKPPSEPPKKGHVWKACNGEAHTNPFIDHCMMCLNYTWGWRQEKAPKKGGKRK